MPPLRPATSGLAVLVRLAFVALSATLTMACESEKGVAVLYERGNEDPTTHVFPSDEYKGSEALDKFSTAQTDLLPFLKQLRFTAQVDWAPTTAVRIPFTPVPYDTDRWLDPDTIRPALRAWRLDTDGSAALRATPVELGEVVYRERSGALMVWPRAPWAPGRYAFAVLDGVLGTRGGGTVGRSPDAARVAREGDPETNAAFTAVAAVDDAIEVRDDALVFWTFSVADATGQMQLLAAYVSGKLPVDRAGQDEILDITPIVPEATRELAQGGARILAQGDEFIQALFDSVGAGALPHDAIDKVVGGAIATPVFVSDTKQDPDALPLNGTFLGESPLMPFKSDNKLSLSVKTPSRLLPYVAAFPKVHATPMPVIVAIHGIARSKEDWLAFANVACKTGHAIIGIDLYQHGDRQEAIDVPEGSFSDKFDAFLASQGVFFPDPFLNPTFIARTRDKLRQSVVDQLALVRLLDAADGASPLIDFDGDGQPDEWGPIRIVAQSLGAMVATPVVALSPAIDRAILNVPGADLSQIAADSPRISKDLDLLIYGSAGAEGIGLLAGSPRFLVPDGAEREVYNQVAQTVLAAVDPGTFAGAMVSGALGNSQPRLLIQLAQGDTVVPNNANIRYVLALAGGGADPSEVPQLTPVLFPTGLPVIDGSQGPLVPIAVTQFAGDHGFLLDFEDPAVTAAAQTQAAQFLAAP